MSCRRGCSSYGFLTSRKVPESRHLLLAGPCRLRQRVAGTATVCLRPVDHTRVSNDRDGRHNSEYRIGSSREGLYRHLETAVA